MCKVTCDIKVHWDEITEKESDRDIRERGKETDKHKLVERMIQTETDGGREIDTEKRQMEVERERDRRGENIWKRKKQMGESELERNIQIEKERMRHAKTDR